MKISLRRDVACKVSRLRGLKSMFLRLWLEPKEILKLPLGKIEGHLLVLFPYKPEPQG